MIVGFGSILFVKHVKLWVLKDNHYACNTEHGCKLFVLCLVCVQNDIGAFKVPNDAELETKEHVVVYDSNTSSLKDKSELLFFELCILTGNIII